MAVGTGKKLSHFFDPSVHIFDPPESYYCEQAAGTAVYNSLKWKTPYNMRKKENGTKIAIIMQTQKIEWLTSFTIAEILKFEKYLRSVRGSNTLVSNRDDQNFF